MYSFAPTVEDLQLMFGHSELLELSNPSDPNATVVDVRRVELAIADATEWLMSRLAAAGATEGAELVIANQRRVIGVVARYYLDTLRTRENVREDYEETVKEVDRQIELWRQRYTVSSIRWSSRSFPLC